MADGRNFEVPPPLTERFKYFNERNTKLLKDYYTKNKITDLMTFNEFEVIILFGYLKELYQVKPYPETYSELQQYVKPQLKETFETGLTVISNPTYMEYRESMLILYANPNKQMVPATVSTKQRLSQIVNRLKGNPN